MCAKVIEMGKKVFIRMFFAQSCGCSCKPNKDVAALDEMAEKLTLKFGAENLEFEGYVDLNVKKFPFLATLAGADGKTKLPILSVGERVVSQGAMPKYADLEKEIEKMLKAA